MKDELDNIDSWSTQFVTAIAHYYRGEMARANIWRTRLDVTTNWAIVTTAAFLSFSFGTTQMPHFVILLGNVFVFFFLIIEARRYKYFDLWRWRVALLNENFFAQVVDPGRKPLHENWRELLGRELQHSHFKMTFLEAFGRRLRRNYGWIFGVLVFCWFTKVAIHPQPMSSLSEIWQRAAIYHLVPGQLVLAAGVIFNLGLVFVAIFTRTDREEIVRIYPMEKHPPIDRE